MTETTDYTQPTRARVPWGWQHIVGAVLAGFVLGVLLSTAALGLLGLLGIPLSEIAQGGILTVGLYLGLAVSTWLVVIKRGGATWRDVGFRPVSVRTLLTMIPVLILLLVANALVSVALVAIFGDIQNPQAEMLAPDGRLSQESFLWLFPGVAIVGPIVEEILFRGVLYPYIRARMRVLFAVLLVAGIFSAVHVIPILLLPLFVAGVALTLVTERYDSIIPAIVLHGLFNGLQISLLYAATG
ncbi:MAG: CPBP family intramembrane metalloprotease [Chloroflexia bacterium]|nr:CPBP family intramembrane metalloprotease [Chloroflexia bacterium]